MNTAYRYNLPEDLALVSDDLGFWRETLRDLVHNGIDRPERLAETFDVSTDSLEELCSHLGIELRRPSRKQITRRIQTALEVKRLNILLGLLGDGETSLQVLSEAIGMSSGRTVIGYADRGLFTLPDDLGPFRTRPEYDELIDEGLLLKEIAAKLDCTSEAVRQYVKFSGQKSYWQERVKERQERLKQPNEKELRRESLSRILYAIGHHMREKADWAEGKALEYLAGRPRTTTTFDQLLTLFRAYEGAKKSGKRLSLQDLGEASDIYFTHVGQIFKAVDVEPLYGNSPRKSVPGWKHDAVERTLDLTESHVDVAYFIGLPAHTVSERRRGVASRSRAIYFRNLEQTSAKRLLLSCASEIYEASDLGFSLREISDLVEKPAWFVHSALERREEVSERIVLLLDRLYPTQMHEQPYL